MSDEEQTQQQEQAPAADADGAEESSQQEWESWDPKDRKALFDTRNKLKDENKSLKERLDALEKDKKQRERDAASGDLEKQLALVTKERDEALAQNELLTGSIEKAAKDKRHRDIIDQVMAHEGITASRFAVDAAIKTLIESDALDGESGTPDEVAKRAVAALRKADKATYFGAKPKTTSAPANAGQPERGIIPESGEQQNAATRGRQRNKERLKGTGIPSSLY